LNKINTAILPGIGWLIISTILFIIPGSSFPKENFLDKIFFDKWVHIGLFAIMVFLFCWSQRKKSISEIKLKKMFVLIFFLAVAYGISIEFIQKYFVPNRGFELEDIIADTIGAGLGLFYSVKRYIKNRPL
jgi:VanZ family protein